ncbi:MAG: uroporphyrinogen-III synthase, partial [Caulobacterales bacterium]|nr:uroporphyrinogen-III synthase [Caulobacterales bacterium]
SAQGDVEDLAALAAARLSPGAGPVLYLRAAQAAGDLVGALSRAGFDARDAAAYETVAEEALPAAAREALAEGAVDAVLFHSARGAGVFAALVGAAALAGACAGLAAAAMSRQALEPAGSLPFAARRAAPRPTEADLFAALTDALAARG